MTRKSLRDGNRLYKLTNLSDLFKMGDGDYVATFMVDNAHQLMGMWAELFWIMPKYGLESTFNFKNYPVTNSVRTGK